MGKWKNGISIQWGDEAMAATPKGISKIKLDMMVVERSVYDEYTRWCSKHGYSPNVLIEKFMRETVLKP